MQFDLTQVVLLWGGTLAASVLRAFTGFGFALAMVPILSLFLEPADAVALSAAMALTLGALAWRSYWYDVRPRELVPLVTTSVLGTVVGVITLAGMSGTVFRVSVGVSVLIACIGLGAARRVTVHVSPSLAWLAGLASGLMNGAMSIPGPPIIVYTLLAQRDPRRSRSLMTAFFSLSALFALTVFGVSGMFNKDVAVNFLICLPVLYVGDRWGQLLFLRYGDGAYGTVAVTTLFSIGVVILLRAVLRAMA